MPRLRRHLLEEKNLPKKLRDGVTREQHTQADWMIDRNKNQSVAHRNKCSRQNRAVALERPHPEKSTTRGRVMQNRLFVSCTNFLLHTPDHSDQETLSQRERG